MARYYISTFIKAYYSLQIYTPINIGIIIFNIWIFNSILYALPVFGLWAKIGMHDNPKNKWMCYIKDNPPCSGNAKSFLKVSFLWLFIIPFLTLIFCYIAIFRMMKKNQKELGQYFSTDHAAKRAQNFKFMKMMVFVTMGFVLTFTPLMTFNVLNKGDHPNWEVCLDILWWTSAVVNPLIFFMMSTTFRINMTYYLKRMFCQSVEKPTSQSKTFKASSKNLKSTTTTEK